MVFSCFIFPDKEGNCECDFSDSGHVPAFKDGVSTNDKF